MTREGVTARVRANRANARKSTGPKSAEGRARVARNAIVHGLEARRQLRSNHQEVQALVNHLVQEVQGASAEAVSGLREAAVALADAQFAVIEVQAMRRLLWQAAMQELTVSVLPPAGKVGVSLRDLNASAALVRRRVARLASDINARPGAVDIVPDIERLERYERRAMARRKCAMRRFAAVVALCPRRTDEITGPSVIDSPHKV